jgi:kynurenine 3-monooxygenase
MHARQNIIIVGAGLVGSLLAIYLAKKGYTVAVFDKNADPQETYSLSSKSSINLTLCDRGFDALAEVGIDNIIRDMTLPIYGRLIHNVQGETTFQHYGTNNQALYSILRDDLNNALLCFARQNFDIDFHFNEKCVGVDLAHTTLTFGNRLSGAVSQHHARVIFGADGAFSTIRMQLQKTDRFNYSQQYMTYGYRELTIPAKQGSGWLTEKRAIHFWPRGHYMLMGFANRDGSFTLSLHMPFKGAISFEAIQTERDLLDLFEQSFPDVLPRIPTLLEHYFSRPTNSMITVRCSPWSFQDKVALIGDSAHAIVPYYGQGANAGFEDCTILNRCLDQYGDDWGMIFSEYERLRKQNTDMIADLALHNFVELSDQVADPRFLLRKTIERRVSIRYPEKYSSLYSMIAFSSIPYIEALHIDQQRRVFIDQIMCIEDIEARSEPEIDSIIDALMHTSSSL